MSKKKKKRKIKFNFKQRIKKLLKAFAIFFVSSRLSESQKIGKQIMKDPKKSRECLMEILNADKDKVANGETFIITISGKRYKCRQLG